MTPGVKIDMSEFFFYLWADKSCDANVSLEWNSEIKTEKHDNKA